jgi:hypothetical protein
LSGHNALLQNEGLAQSATFCRLTGRIPLPGDHRAALSRLVRAPALVLM